MRLPRVDFSTLFPFSESILLQNIGLVWTTWIIDDPMRCGHRREATEVMQRETLGSHQCIPWLLPSHSVTNLTVLT